MLEEGKNGLLKERENELLEEKKISCWIEEKGAIGREGKKCCCYMRMLQLRAAAHRCKLCICSYSACVLRLTR